MEQEIDNNQLTELNHVENLIKDLILKLEEHEHNIKREVVNYAIRWMDKRDLINNNYFSQIKAEKALDDELKKLITSATRYTTFNIFQFLTDSSKICKLYETVQSIPIPSAKSEDLFLRCSDCGRIESIPNPREDSVIELNKKYKSYCKNCSHATVWEEIYPVHASRVSEVANYNMFEQI